MVAHIHLIGIGGIGMSAVARLLLRSDTHVTGSDAVISPLVKSLRKEGALVGQEEAVDWLTPSTLVVFSTDIRENHPERMRAKELGCRMLHRSEMLFLLQRQARESVAITGSHGKTTTSALLSWVLVHAGWDPAYAVGGILANTERNAAPGDGPFIFEADESDGSFLNYTPTGAIITNIDNDHMNHYGTLDALKSAVKQFAGQVSDPNRLIWCADDPYLSIMGLPGISYGKHPQAICRLLHVEPICSGYQFTILFKEELIKGFLPLVGSHQVLNATAVIAAARQMGVPVEKILQGLASFQGTARRCQIRRRTPFLMIDDYAHHPTEIRATLQGLAEIYPTHRLHVCFQPHRYTRTRDCFHQFKEAFHSYHTLVITDLYGAGEPPICGIDTPALITTLPQKTLHVPRHALADYFLTSLGPNDLLVTMGAGDITKLADEIDP